MDEIKGTLKDFTGATLTMESQEQTYVFDLSEATLECEDGMITGDESVSFMRVSSLTKIPAL